MNSLMKKLEYENPPNENNYQKYRTYIENVSDHSCSYCTITESESPGATFNLDHFRPAKLFPQYKVVCVNMRYSCPRCNSYKKEKWITEVVGCKRKCDSCIDKLCTKNYLRFIDCLNEDPTMHLHVNGSFELEAEENSNPGIYTIKALRLNRLQLIKLRRIRQEINNWKEELYEMRKNAICHIKRLEIKKEEFESIITQKIDLYSERELALIEVIRICFEATVTQANFLFEFINEEIKKVENIENSRMGTDNI